MTFIFGNLRKTSLYDELAVVCRSSSVIFSSSSDLTTGGSGTLVIYKQLRGILTATHVMAKSNSVRARHIFAPLLQTTDPTLFLNIPVPIKRILHIETSKGLRALKKRDWPFGALDICLIEIDPHVFDFLLNTSGKQAIDLLEHKQKYLLNEDKYCCADFNNDWCWALDGGPREAATHKDRILFSKFDGLYVCGGSMEGSTYKTDHLTLVRPPFEKTADRGQHDLGPTFDILPGRFSGVSGAGMRQIKFNGENGVPESIGEMLFSGICVAEVPGKRLYSRGPSALYDTFTAYLDSVS